MKAVSIVVPTLNESENVAVLVRRIAKSFQQSGVRYEIIFVDDHSTDGTASAIQKLAKRYPVSLYEKVGSRGKAYSLLQGFGQARYGVICMIDADLQYPPEAILPMYELMQSTGTDVILTERQDDMATSKLRQLSSKIFNLAFTRILFGFDYDSQSGLKLFKKNVLDNTKLNPTPWSFDLEFIVRALENNYKILSYKIPFSKRHSGQAKVRVARVAYELMVASIKLRLSSSRRRIKQAYHISLEAANRTLGLFILLLGSMASLVLAQPVGVTALLPSNQNAPTVLQLHDTTDAAGVTNPGNISSPSSLPANQNEPSQLRNTTEDPGASNTLLSLSNDRDASSPTEQNASAPSRLRDTTEVSDATYPRYVYTPSSAVYGTATMPMPYDLVRLWAAGLVAVLVIVSASELIAIQRGVYINNLKKGAK